MSRRSNALAAVLLATAAIAGCRTKRAPIEAAPAPAPTPVADPASGDVTVVPQLGGVGTFVALAEAGDRRTAFVADEEDAAVVAVDLAKKEVVARAPLRGTPGQLLVAQDGTIYAAVRGAAEIVALRLVKNGSFREVARRATGHEPYGLAARQGAILLTSIGDTRLETYAANDLAPGAVAPLPRDPRGVVVTLNGAKAFVAHATGSTLSVIDLGSASPAPRAITMDLLEHRRDFGMKHAQKPMAPMRGPHGFMIPSKVFDPPAVAISMTRNATQGFGLAQIGDELFVPESLVLTGDKNLISTGYGSTEASTLGSNVPYVARIAVDDEKPRAQHFSGPSDRVCFEKSHECLLPRAVATDGKKAYVACLDSDEVLVVDPKVDVEHYGGGCEKAIQGRVRLKVERPSGVAVDRDREEVVAFSVFTRKLSIARTHGLEDAVSIALPRVGTPPSEQVILGRNLFHETRDARISGDGRACASCHVDGREDGMIWPTPKGTRQTPMLAGRLEGTGPFGWHGEHATLPIHITETIKNLGGKGLPPESVEALGAYAASMKVPVRRASANDAVARGKEIFESSDAECASCHVEKTRFTDGEAHALAHGKEPRFDTPSLHFVGLTAPYFHDGRFKTLEELIDKCDGTMGNTKQLSSNDRQALAAFLRTL